MKKKFILITILLLFASAFIGCSGEKAFPDDLFIEAEDAVGVPKGDYGLVYTVNNFAKYEKKYDLSVSVTAYDEKNLPATVKNNRTLTVETEKIYTVVVRVSGLIGGESLSMTRAFTVESEKASRVVTFMHGESEIVKKIFVPYGGSVPLADVPELDDRYTSAGEGYRTKLISKRWVVYGADGNAIELNAEHLTDITENIPVYSDYAYETVALPFFITFDSDGGTEIPKYEGNADTVVPKQPSPQKAGYTFVGWCTDKERRELYSWTSNLTLVRDKTLYARYVKNTENATPYSAFSFNEETDEFGNAYYSISARDRTNLVGKLVLPNNYNGLPVRGMTENAFKGTGITAVTVPNSYTLDNQGGFYGCGALETVEFEEGNESTVIATDMFCQCTMLRSIVLPSTVRIIRDNAFRNCTALSSVKLPESLAFVNNSAFRGCMSLTKVEFPASTESLLDDAFRDCVSLKTVVFNDRLRYVGDRAFYGCERLETVAVGEKSKLSIIGEEAFTGTAIKEITLPAVFKDASIFGETEIRVSFYPPIEK